MNTKIVYVVTSTEEDVYLEQTLLSVYSLRKWMPSAFVELVVDSLTDKTISGKRAEILKYVSQKVVINVPDNYSKVQASRYIKTQLREFIIGDFLFVDSDTIITDSLEDIDSFDGSIGMVPDVHSSYKVSIKDCEMILKRMKRAGYEGNDMIPYFNSGVIFVRDNDEGHKLYKQWNKRWNVMLMKYGFHYDQPSLAVANSDLSFPIKELGGEWNCQIVNSGIPFLYKAKIIHYYASFNQYLFKNGTDKPYMFFDNQIYNDIKRDGLVPQYVVDFIDNAKGAFASPNRVVVGNEFQLLFDSLHKMALNHPRIYYFFNFVSRILGYIFKKVGIDR